MSKGLFEATCFGLSTLLAGGLAAQTCRDPTSTEQARIQELTARDKAASVAGDWRELASLWTDDAVALPPGEPPVVGIEAIRSWLEHGHIDASKVQVLDYSIDIHGTQVCGDTAIQWATTRVVMKPNDAPRAMRASGNIERLLRRQPDGSWKVQRAIWNMGSPAPDKAGDRGR